MKLHTPLSLGMSVFLLELAACIILASACAALFVELRMRFRQRSLHKIPGPSNPSLLWGKFLRLPKDRSHVERNEQVIRTKCTIPIPFRSTKDYTGHMDPRHASMVFWGYARLTEFFFIMGPNNECHDLE